MVERKTRKRPARKRADQDTNEAPVAPAAPAFVRHEADESERKLGRAVAFGLPLMCLVAAMVVGVVAGVGSALLVLASGALLGAIGLLWASVRTLSGDAPLPEDLEVKALQRHDVDELAERKRRVLRALKDLESEHALGKIDDADYREVVARYRDEAKRVMKEMDGEVAPLIQEAERVATEYLAKRGGGQPSEGAAHAGVDGSPRGTASNEAVSRAQDSRAACPSCATSNEADATFCKQCGASMKGAPTTEKIDAPT
jgi:hypothetical protein